MNNIILNNNKRQEIIRLKTIELGLKELLLTNNSPKLKERSKSFREKILNLFDDFLNEHTKDTYNLAIKLAKELFIKKREDIITEITSFIAEIKKEIIELEETINTEKDELTKNREQLNTAISNKNREQIHEKNNQGKNIDKSLERVNKDITDLQGLIKTEKEGYETIKKKVFNAGNSGIDKKKQKEKIKQELTNLLKIEANKKKKEIENTNNIRKNTPEEIFGFQIPSSKFNIHIPNGARNRNKDKNDVDEGHTFNKILQLKNLLDKLGVEVRQEDCIKLGEALLVYIPDYKKSIFISNDVNSQGKYKYATYILLGEPEQHNDISDIRESRHKRITQSNKNRRRNDILNYLLSDEYVLFKATKNKTSTPNASLEYLNNASEICEIIKYNFPKQKKLSHESFRKFAEFYNKNAELKLRTTLLGLRRVLGLRTNINNIKYIKLRIYKGVRYAKQYKEDHTRDSYENNSKYRKAIKLIIELYGSKLFPETLLGSNYNDWIKRPQNEIKDKYEKELDILPKSSTTLTKYLGGIQSQDVEYQSLLIKKASLWFRIDGKNDNKNKIENINRQIEVIDKKISQKEKEIINIRKPNKLHSNNKPNAINHKEKLDIISNKMAEFLHEPSGENIEVMCRRIQEEGNTIDIRLTLPSFKKKEIGKKEIFIILNKIYNTDKEKRHNIVLEFQKQNDFSPTDTLISFIIFIITELRYKHNIKQKVGPIVIDTIARSIVGNLQLETELILSLFE